MRSRRDQLQAYQFLRRRVITAFVSAAPDSPDFPMRRMNPTALVGLVVAAVLVGVFAVLGLISPGHATGWRHDGAVVVEQETGARYVYFQGKLHPMLNYASARLFAGAGDATVHQVSRRSLSGVPRTTAQGIAGAPDALPPAGGLVRGPWSVCVRPDATPTTVALLGVGQAGRRSLAGGAGVLVAATGGGDEYLVWHDQRLRVRDRGVLVPLGFPDPTPRPVGAAWLNSLPAGPDLAFPDVPGRGGPGPVVAGQALRSGELVVVHNGSQTQYAIAEPAGLAPVTPLVAALIRADPRTATAYPGQPVTDITVSPADFTLAHRLAPLAGTARYPAQPLVPAALAGGTDTLCVTVTDPGPGAVTVWLVDELTDAGRAVVGHRPAGPPPADRIAVPPGRGAVVRDLPQPGVSSGTWFLVTDDGVKYPIGSSDAAKALGYGDVHPVGLPPGFLDLLPTGPTLDRPAAAVQVPPATR